MHDGELKAGAALDPMISGLRKKGYRLERLG